MFFLNVVLASNKGQGELSEKWLNVLGLRQTSQQATGLSLTSTASVPSCKVFC